MPDIVQVPKIERRFLSTTAGAELRVADPATAGAMPTIVGVAVPWESLSVEIWRDWSTNKPIYERFRRGAFSEVLAQAGLDVICVRDHDRSRLLGRTVSSTLRLSETDRGLEYQADPPDTTDGRDVVALLRRGDLSGSSFAFTVVKQEWEETDAAIIRTVLQVGELEDVSVVTRPAYLESAATVSRSIEAAQASLAAWRGDPAAWRHHLAEGEARLLELGL